MKNAPPLIANLPDCGNMSRWPWKDNGSQAAVSDGMPVDLPFVTIVTPSYNQGKYLEQTIRSVLLQGYPNIEYMVIDGGSTDNSVDIIKRYEKFLSFWVSEPDRGQSHAINKGLQRAKGEVCAWLNSDDYLAPEALWKIVKLRQENPDAVAWVGAVKTINCEGRPLYTHPAARLERDLIADWTGGEHFCQPGCFFSRAAFREAGPLCEDFHFAMDVDLWIRLSGVGRFAGTNELVACEIHHSEAKTVSQRGSSVAEVHMAQIRNGFDDLARKRISEELQELFERREGSLLVRLRWSLNLVLRPFLETLGRLFKRPGS